MKNTDIQSGNYSNTPQKKSPSFTLQKGDAAIPNIFEKFVKIYVTYTGSITAHITVSSGRSKLSPQLSASYYSYPRKRPLGLGWILLPSTITIKIDITTSNFVKKYSPPNEGLLSRIKKCSNKSDRFEIFWRFTSKDIITTRY